MAQQTKSEPKILLRCERTRPSCHARRIRSSCSEGSEATQATAQAELAAAAAELERTYPVNRGRGINVEPLAEVVFGSVRPTLYILLSAAAIVLLVACVNVASLLLAHGTAGTRAWRAARVDPALVLRGSD